MRCHRILVLLGLAGCAGVLQAQTAGPCLDRTVVASVIDKSGNPVINLQAANFRGQVGGRDVTIVSAEPVPAARRIVILLDASGSMLDDLPVARTVALDLLSAAPQSQVSLVTFADKVEVRVGFTESHSRIADALQTVTPGKRTALHDALIAGLQLLDPPGPDDLVFLITDGGNNLGNTTDAQVEKALRTSQVRTLAFLFVDSVAPTPEEVRLGSDVSDLIEPTGGAVARYERRGLRQTSPAQLQLAVNRLIAQAVYAYRLRIQIGAPIDKPKHWRLKVVDVPEKIRGAKITYPDELMPCAGSGSMTR